MAIYTSDIALTSSKHQMWHLTIVSSVILYVLKPTSSAVFSAQALPPKDPSKTYFSAVLYSRADSTVDKPYPPIKVYCTAALISSKWLITSLNCPFNMKWKVIVGVSRVPRYSIHRKNNFGIKRTINSLDSLLLLIEIDRRVNVTHIKPAEVSEFNPNMTCIIASWMNTAYHLVAKRATIQVVSKQLHCQFAHQNTSVCQAYVNEDKLDMEMATTDICLIQKIKDDPVALCKNDIGAPVVCDGFLVGLIYFIPNVNQTRSSDCYRNKTGKFYPATAIYPLSDWVDFFTFERANSSAKFYLCNHLSMFILSVLISVMHVYII